MIVQIKTAASTAWQKVKQFGFHLGGKLEGLAERHAPTLRKGALAAAAAFGFGALSQSAQAASAVVSGITQLDDLLAGISATQTVVLGLIFAFGGALVIWSVVRKARRS